MKWPGNKHKKKLRGVKKSISWSQLRFTNPSKEQTEVSMDEVRRQASMMCTHGVPIGGGIKNVDVSEKTKRRGRPRVTKKNP